MNTDLLPAANKAIDTMNVARRHAESVADEMGAEWVADLLRFHETNTRQAIRAYVNASRCDDPAIRLTIEGNLLRQAGLSAEVAA